MRTWLVFSLEALVDKFGEGVGPYAAQMAEQLIGGCGALWGGALLRAWRTHARTHAGAWAVHLQHGLPAPPRNKSGV